jgi:hypothetical protein
MNRAIKDLLLLVTGGIIGSGITYAVIKHKLDKQSQEDEWNRQRTEKLKWDAMNPPEEEDVTEDPETAERIRQTHEKPDVATLAAEYHEYHDYTKHYKRESEEVEEDIDPLYGIDDAEKMADDEDDEDPDETIYDNPPTSKRGPYPILQERFGLIETYDTMELVYYSDGILVDGNSEVVIDPISVIGEHAFEMINENDTNEVWVCNPRYACYYDIIKDLDPYFSDPE